MIYKLDNLKVGLPIIIPQNQIQEGIYYNPSHLNNSSQQLRIRRLFDFVIDLQSFEDHFESILNERNIFSSEFQSNFLFIYHFINPGGYLLTCNFVDETVSPLTNLLQSQQLWKFLPNSLYFYISLIFSCSKLNFLGLKKRSICCNNRAALYWGADGTSIDEVAINQLRQERELLEDITVTQTVQHTGDYYLYASESISTSKSISIDSNNPFLRMTSGARDKAIQALENHGVCIIRNLFPAEVIRRWGDAALQDLELASTQLKSTKGLFCDYLHFNYSIISHCLFFFFFLGIDLDHPIEGQVSCFPYFTT